MLENKIKPKVEEIASEYLDGEALDNLLDFVAWMREKRMTPTFANKSSIGVNYTSRICYLKLRHGSWYIWPAGRKKERFHEYVYGFLVCEALKELVSTSLAPCMKGCSHQCNGGSGYTVTVCGKDFENKCCCCPVRFHNPDAEALKIIKKVFEKTT
ncbi:MAG: hypothetical protein FWE80_07560 [Oscillospiraceae bacterium]|nr:hypothetical protein [Oscillospiraceae bacterium]